MTIENIENNRINQALIDENNHLRDELLHYKARNLALAQRCRKLSIENMKISSELADLKFCRKVFGEDGIKGGA